MAILTREKLTNYGIEVLVVVFGILIAFQVEEWREDRQRGRDLDAALIRLSEETTTNLKVCELLIPVHADHARWVLDVVRVLNGGRLDDTNIESFEAGLIRVGYLTGAPYSQTVAQEMIATGLLKDLENKGLRSRIAELPVWIENVHKWNDDTRGAIGSAVAEVTKAVNFRYDGELAIPEHANGFNTDFEDSIGVDYVLADLRANRTLRNVFVEAADTHLDMLRNHQDVCRKFEEIQSSLAEMNPY